MKKQPIPPAKNGAIDVEPMVAKARAGVPPNLQPAFDKVVLSGMRVMFDRNSHKMMLDELNQPGPLAQRIANGIIKLMYLLWTQSNRTIPPQLIVPATLVLALRAFQFLQESKDPEATKEVLGEAVAGAVQGVMDRFGATEDRLPALLKGQQAGAPGGQPPAQPAGSGMLSQ